jgi:hypothetical protein
MWLRPACYGPGSPALFKSKAPRPKDHLDAEMVAPVLAGSQRAWLAGLLPTGHPWQALLDRGRRAQP